MSSYKIAGRFTILRDAGHLAKTEDCPPKGGQLAGLQKSSRSSDPECSLCSLVELVSGRTRASIRGCPRVISVDGLRNKNVVGGMRRPTL